MKSVVRYRFTVCGNCGAVFAHTGNGKILTCPVCRKGLVLTDEIRAELGG